MVGGAAVDGAGTRVPENGAFSNGCTSQYKGKTCFVDISFSETDTGIISERHFFGSGHGKSVCDGEIGVVKRSAALVIKAGTTVISNATGLHSYSARKLTLPSDNTTHSHNRRTVVYVPMGAIQRNRHGRTSSETKTVPGTRTLHSICGMLQYKVSTRNFSCFCKFCRDPASAPDGENVCQHFDICGEWSAHNMLKNQPPNHHGRRAVQIAEQPFNDADQEPPATPTPSPHHDSPLPVTPSVSTLDQLDDPLSPASSMSSRPALLPVISGADTVCSSSPENSPTASDHKVDTYQCIT